MHTVQQTAGQLHQIQGGQQSILEKLKADTTHSHDSWESKTKNFLLGLEPHWRDPWQDEWDPGKQGHSTHRSQHQGIIMIYYHIFNKVSKLILIFVCRITLSINQGSKVSKRKASDVFPEEVSPRYLFGSILTIYEWSNATGATKCNKCNNSTQQLVFPEEVSPRYIFAPTGALYVTMHLPLFIFTQPNATVREDRQ